MEIYSKDGYYEAKLQLRHYNKEVLDFVIKQLKENNVKIGKEVKLKTGIDLYLSSRKFTTQIAKKLKRRFKGTVKVSKKLFSFDKLKSKKVYRVTVCFRLNNT
jgi:NMD protein affecting ribosome stability and mRNA decay